ncbi:glucosaminidase domain-containing protein [Chryseobacterium oryctis]|uniref:Mannosyl-glycoprotein endo-beta-N-acetylglucosamidase-like domain-containing protein n=1 Tax=Chryseobacterium oryctis TaxID=2952618 RepID=A0ABT3HNV7_9FLAO|nr:glucosaminidase domain-containing protein [Chryseobacterium oryctis]MCW3161429.1 hypothetical protein [Chryseobacterium oryctis]
MAKQGVSKISGNSAPKVGEKTVYTVTEWYPGTPKEKRNPALVTWELFKKRSNGQFTTTNIKKKGDGSFTFGEVADRHSYRLEAYLYEPEGSGATTININPQQAEIPKINKVELHYVDDSKGNTFSYREKLVAKAHTVSLAGKDLVFTLWEDDAKGSGHNSKNLFVDSKKGTVGNNGLAQVEFVLTKALMQKAMQGETDAKELEFYVTVEYYRDKKHATDNIDVKNPDYKPPVASPKPSSSSKSNIPQPSSTPQKPKAQGSPAAQKPESKKEEKGIIDIATESVVNKWNELWDWVESKGKIVQQQMPTLQKPDGKTVTKVGGVKKEIFPKVVGLGKEAVIYISSEIATEIKVDNKGKITSHPDHGGYNGMEEYKEGDKLYCKKLSKTSSAFPLYKMYIYRGSKIGEAVKKLKQDLEFKTHENAESEVLTVARHAQKNNKDYGKSGPLPPNTVTSLYRIRYMQAWNHAGKESFRYRIVTDNATNLKTVDDVGKEVSSGAMTLGSRSSISIDPWRSSGLIGCVGIRNSDGETHPSCAKEYPNQDAENYKFIYHALNNYLEGIVPELTGVYGRRGYSSSGKVAVAASAYKEEVKVFVLIDPLPEINACKLNLKKDGREEFYKEFGTAAIDLVESKGKSNKFKGLYMVAQRRQENGFKLAVPNNNPMNIKGQGDLGSSPLKTHEYENGKKVNVTDGFANFSTVEKGFEGYLSLLDRNYNEAYNAILDDSKTIDDFLVGMQDKGKLGAYATDPNYKTLIKGIFNGVVKDYKAILEYKLCIEKKEEEKNKIKKDIELLDKLK